jgi:CheY-like chemotaxis protein/phosphoribosyl 1,2-cyclic phosphodiesterase
MRVQFWGTRGSIATPGPETLRYGGNTPCTAVWTNDGSVIIFDCGTGARKLGLALAQGGPLRAHLCVGHTHADHIQGLPFFLPAFLPGSHLTIYGPSGIDRSLPQAIGGQMEYAYFPVPMHALPAQLDFQELSEGEFRIGDVLVRTQYLNHTAPCIGYRLEERGAVLVYATDHEMHAPTLWRPDRPPDCYEPAAMLHPADARHAEFLRDADLVIHDCQYTGAEYPAKVGWGHSTIEYAVDVSLAAGVKRLALFHYDPTRTDDEVDGLLAACRQRVAASGRALDVIAAAEGVEVTLAPGVAHPSGAPVPQAPRVPLAARVLVCDDDDAIAKVLETALRRDGYEVLRARNGAEAVTLAAAEQPDLILLDVEMPEMDGFTACRTLRANPTLSSVPIVMLTARTEEQNILRGFDGGATDYITKPFSVAQVRARVRSWLTRAASER